MKKSTENKRKDVTAVEYNKKLDKKIKDIASLPIEDQLIELLNECNKYNIIDDRHNK